MSKSFLLFLLVLGVTKISYGQLLNLKVGGNMSTFAGAGLERLNNSSRLTPGVDIGISYEDFATRSFTVEIGGGIVLENFRLKDDIDYNATIVNFYALGRIYRDRFFITAGPEFHFNVYTHIEGRGRRDITENCNVVTLGPSIGIGHMIGTRSSVSFRFNMNLHDFFEDDPKIYSRTLFLGFSFGLNDPITPDKGE